MSGAKGDTRNDFDGQRKCRLQMRRWSLIRTHRGSLPLAFFGVPSHWHQDNLAEKTKEESEESIKLAKSKP